MARLVEDEVRLLEELERAVEVVIRGWNHWGFCSESGVSALDDDTGDQP